MIPSLLTVALAVTSLCARVSSAQKSVETPAVRADHSDAASDLYNETYRPQFHFTPARNWMNDPNGPVYYKGEYHLFYQYNPFGVEWGHMNWGHAVSRDLVHWRHLPIALAEENGVMMFSGSTVVDWHNSGGFCHGPSADVPTCLIAIYTGHSPKLETQNVAYSNDDGLTWTKYAQNPVIDLQLSSFRDPKVFWHEGTHKWVMVTVLASQHKARFFGSTDLKHWTFLSDFGPAGATGGAWECPDLFPLPVDNEAAQTKWVLSVSVTSGGVTGGAGNRYFIGAFDGTTFSAEASGDRTLWADYGTDFYASTSFSDIPKSDGRRIWLGWLTNWEYAGTWISPWRGMHSIPRQLRLKRYPDGIRLVQEPVSELRTLRTQHTSTARKSVADANRWWRSKDIHGDTLEMEVEIEIAGASEVGLKVRKGPQEETLVGVSTGNPKEVRLFVDRTHSGNIKVDEKFPGRNAGPLRLAERQRVKLHVFIDRSSVEVFGNDGETVISDVIFPAGGSQGVEFYSLGGEARIVSLDVWNLQSAWRP